MSSETAIREISERIHGHLTSMERYNADNIPDFEKFVELQAQLNAYDNEANLALLKLYQFYPERFNTKFVSIILLKAITKLPHTDFALCKYLIDIQQLSDELIAPVIAIGDVLERCEFSQFWKDIDENRSVVQGVKGFEISARKFISHVVGITYQKVSKSLLAQILNLSDPALLSEWISKQGWSELDKENDQDEPMVYIQNHEESIKSRNIKERVNFDAIAEVTNLGH